MLRTQIAALIVPTQPAAPVAVGKVDADPMAPIAGKSISSWLVDAALAASVRRIGIVAAAPSSAERSELAARSDDALVEFITPTNRVTETLLFAIERLGSELTLRDSTNILILPAECPQIEGAELRSLVDRHIGSQAAATLLTPPPTEARSEPVVIRDAEGQIVSIADDVSTAPGIMCIRAPLLIPALHRTIAPRWQAGAPLAEIVGVLQEVGHPVDVVDRDEPIRSITSVATRAPIETELRDRVIQTWIDRDVTMTDPRQVSIDATVTIGKGVQLLPGTVLEGSTVIGDGAVIGPNSHIVDSTIGSRSTVPHSVVNGAEVPPRQQVRPFSVLSAVTR